MGNEKMKKFKVYKKTIREMFLLLKGHQIIGETEQEHIFEYTEKLIADNKQFDENKERYLPFEDHEIVYSLEQAKELSAYGFDIWMIRKRKECKGLEFIYIVEGQRIVWQHRKIKRIIDKY